MIRHVRRRALSAASALPALAALAIGSAVLTASPAAADFAPAATPAATTTASALFASLTTATPVGSGYSRDLFPLWVDADGDGCDTRSEVLQAESLTAVTYGSGCTVATGKWFSWYDDATWTSASDVDIDHFVPLKEAWSSGANAWTTAKRQNYANDLGFADSLWAVTDNVNQSKGDKDPASWLPPDSSQDCQYAINWVEVKYRWKLTVDSAEHAALADLLSGSCGATQVTRPSYGS